MNLVSMERPKPEVKETKLAEAQPVDSYYEKYPWGLRLTLNNEELQKLGLSVKDMDVDTEVKITAKALITSISSDKNIESKDKSRDRIELQITDMALVDNEDFGEAWNEAVND